MMHLEPIGHGRGQRLALLSPGHDPAVLDRTAEIGDLRLIFLRHRRWIYATIATMVIGVTLFSALTPALYTTTAQLLIDPRDRQVMTNDINPMTVAPDGGVTQIESQARVIESASVLLRAIAATDLTGDPEFNGKGALAELVRWLGGWFGLGGTEGAPGSVEEETLRNLKRRLSIKRADKVFVIDIIFTAKDPAKAARIANAIANAYLKDQVEARTRGSRAASAALTARLDDQRERVRDAEKRVETYKAAHDLIRSNGRLVTEQQLGEANIQLSAAQSRTAGVKARVGQIDQLRRSGLDVDLTAEAIQSTVLAKLRSQYAELVERQADLRSQLASRHPNIVSADAQIKEVRRLIAAELTRTARAAQADYDRALANEQLLAVNLDRLRDASATTGEASVQLRELDRDLEANRAVYTTFLLRAREVGEQAGIDASNARIISPAIAPLEKSWPLPGLFVAAALATGTVLGLALAVLREYAAPAVFSRKQLHNLTNAPVIGSIHDTSSRDAKRSRAASPIAANTANTLILARLLLIPSGTYSESATVFVTSSDGDASSRRTSARYLASIAESQGLKVLLVEADTIGADASPGLLDVLRGDQRLQAVLRNQPPSKVRSIGIGRYGAGRLDDRTVARERFRSEVGRWFDLVLIIGDVFGRDPRSLPLVSLADTVLLLARQGVTRQGDVLELTEAAQCAGRPISAGLLLTQASGAHA